MKSIAHCKKIDRHTDNSNNMHYNGYERTERGSRQIARGRNPTILLLI